ncbi:MAG: hypothetical protein ACLFQG_09395, partial [Desulfovermiculus sp.]
ETITFAWPDCQVFPRSLAPDCCRNGKINLKIDVLSRGKYLCRGEISNTIASSPEQVNDG